jgi:NAD-specific glutamate dehydrogenase
MQEEIAILSSDGDALLAQATALPQTWRRAGASTAQLDQFRLLDDQAGTNAAPLTGVATTHYAGTYFGVKQALEIDALRAAIGHLARERRVDRWTEAALLTALFSAASKCAFSAGICVSPAIQ